MRRRFGWTTRTPSAFWVIRAQATVVGGLLQGVFARRNARPGRSGFGHSYPTVGRSYSSCDPPPQYMKQRTPRRGLARELEEGTSIGRTCWRESRLVGAQKRIVACMRNDATNMSPIVVEMPSVFFVCRNSARSMLRRRCYRVFTMALTADLRRPLHLARYDRRFLGRRTPSFSESAHGTTTIDRR